MAETVGEKKTENGSIRENLKIEWCQEVPQYGEKLLQRLNGFRKKNMFYDVTLRTTDGDLAAHKVVLAACGGLFRSLFFDPETKKILENVSDVTFFCPASGLRPILKFAYSGILQITEENLFSTYLAAAATDMKEVQEICANIALSRLDWILDFDGSKNTIPKVMYDEAISEVKEELEKAALETTFDFLHGILDLNSHSFSSESEIHQKNEILNRKPSGELLFPCLNEVDKRWPTFTTTYQAIIKCLLYMKDARVRGNNTEGVLSMQEAPPISTTQENNQDTSVCADVTSSVNNSTEVVKITANEQSKTFLKNETTIEDDKLIDNTIVSASQKSRTEVASTVSASINESSHDTFSGPKPTTKPRTKSIAHEPSSQAQSKDSLNKSVSFSESRPAQSKTPLKPSNSSRHSTGPRKKHAAPKPPGPPPNSVKQLQSKHAPGGSSPLQGSPQKSKLAPKTSSGNPNGSAKALPPRPKPPNAKIVKRDSQNSKRYDDALNPFAEDTNDTIDEQPVNYDESLNPFG